MIYKKIFSSEILFTGYYGHFNTGDDAFLEVTSWGAEKYWHKNNNIFLAKEANLPIIDKEIKGYPFSIPRSYRLQNKALLSSTDYLISAGGSTIHSQLQASNIKQLAIKSKQKGSKIKIGGIGVSIGPFKTTEDEKATIHYLKNIDFLSVRDQKSFDFLSTFDLPYEPVNAFDLAALLPEIYEMPENDFLFNDRKVIGISVCPVESINDSNNIENEYKRNAKVVELIKNLDKEERIHFKFFIINGNPVTGDLQLTKETINKALPESYEIVDYNKRTRIMWNEIATCDFVISTRLHAAIFACFSNTPFMLNEYHRKCEDFLDSVSYNREQRLWNSDYDPVEKASTIINMLNNKNNYNYPMRVNKMKDQAKLNFTAVSI